MRACYMNAGQKLAADRDTVTFCSCEVGAISRFTGLSRSPEIRLKVDGVLLLFAVASIDLLLFLNYAFWKSLHAPPHKSKRSSIHGLGYADLNKIASSIL